MGSAIQLLTSNPVGSPQTLDNIDLLAAFLAGRNPRTLRAYSRDLDDFAQGGWVICYALILTDRTPTPRERRQNWGFFLRSYAHQRFALHL